MLNNDLLMDGKSKLVCFLDHSRDKVHVNSHRVPVNLHRVPIIFFPGKILCLYIVI